MNQFIPTVRHWPKLRKAARGASLEVVYMPGKDLIICDPFTGSRVRFFRDGRITKSSTASVESKTIDLQEALSLLGLTGVQLL